MARQTDQRDQEDYKTGQRLIPSWLDDVVSAILIAIIISVLSLAIGYGWGHDAAFNGRCEWRTELYDGEKEMCVDRDDHAAHEGAHAG